MKIIVDYVNVFRFLSMFVVVIYGMLIAYLVISFDIPQYQLNIMGTSLIVLGILAAFNYHKSQVEGLTKWVKMNEGEKAK